MKFWQSVSFSEPDQLVEIARGAEAAGFEGVLVSEHLFVPQTYEPGYLYSEDGRPDFSAETPFPDPWCTISAMAAVTTRLRFATMVYILPLHHPLEVAKQVGTAAILSNDRVVLGAGAGWMKEEFDVLGVDFKSRGARFDEAIDVLRKVWRPEMVDHRGAHFDLPRLQMSPAPSKPVPVFIGGMSKRALRRAAERGDGWLGAGSTPDDAIAILNELTRLRKEAGRESEPFETVVPLVVPPDPDSLKRLSEAGCHGTVNYPFTYTVGPQSTLQQKLDAMTRFGDEVITPLRDV
ncbi:MAG: LLM class F420-dependent oxidoreductase [Proteobacteria bacterium]|nr:LLM class F420-dependent oxidoreductase [Pseudomonadota bacterium]